MTVFLYTQSIYFFEINKRVFDSLGINYDRSDFIEHTFDTGLGSSGWMRENGYGESIISKFTQKRDALYAEEVIKVYTLEPMVSSVLADLKQNYSLSIATNTKRGTLRLTHGRDETHNLFDVVVCREDYEHTKPAPDAYLATLEKTKLKADEVLVI